MLRKSCALCPCQCLPARICHAGAAVCTTMLLLLFCLLSVCPEPAVSFPLQTVSCTMTHACCAPLQDFTILVLLGAGCLSLLLEFAVNQQTAGEGSWIEGASILVAGGHSPFWNGRWAGVVIRDPSALCSPPVVMHQRAALFASSSC